MEKITDLEASFSNHYYVRIRCKYTVNMCLIYDNKYYIIQIASLLMKGGSCIKRNKKMLCSVYTISYVLPMYKKLHCYF